MSDLSELSLVPRDEELAAAASGPAYPQAFAWPTPPYADYAAATPQSDAQACVIEGMNGKSQQALMTLFDIQAGVVARAGTACALHHAAADERISGGSH